MRSVKRLAALAALLVGMTWTGADLGLGAQSAPRPATVMVLDLDGNGFALTSKEDGVLFDLEGNGSARRVGWTAKNSDDAFLAFDLNKNRTIDGVGELVGSRMRLPDGATPTSGADAMNLNLQGIKVGPDGRLVNGLPEGASLVDARDSFFAQLMLWQDRNHNGTATPDEVRTLTEASVTTIRNGYQRSTVVDEHGNRQRLRGTFTLKLRGMDFERVIVEMEMVR